jgi:hypothetical protein
MSWTAILTALAAYLLYAGGAAKFVEFIDMLDEKDFHGCPGSLFVAYPLLLTILFYVYRDGAYYQLLLERSIEALAEAISSLPRPRQLTAGNVCWFLCEACLFFAELVGIVYSVIWKKFRAGAIIKWLRAFVWKHLAGRWRLVMHWRGRAYITSLVFPEGSEGRMVFDLLRQQIARHEAIMAEVKRLFDEVVENRNRFHVTKHSDKYDLPLINVKSLPVADLSPKVFEWLSYPLWIQILCNFDAVAEAYKEAVNSLYKIASEYRDVLSECEAALASYVDTCNKMNGTIYHDGRQPSFLALNPFLTTSASVSTHRSKSRLLIGRNAPSKLTSTNNDQPNHPFIRPKVKAPAKSEGISHERAEMMAAEARGCSGIPS